MQKNPSSIYGAEPLVTLRARPTSDEVILARKKRHARKKIKRQFLNAGKISEARIEIERLKVATSDDQSKAYKGKGKNPESLYQTVAAEIFDAINLVDESSESSQNLMPDDTKNVLPLTRAERIARRRTQAIERQKQKLGASGVTQVRHRPPIPEITINHLEDITLRTRKARPKDFMPVAVHVKSSKEMNAALSYNMRQLSEESGVNFHRKELDSDHIFTDIWESRLVSQLARPLGIESLLSSKPVTTHEKPTDFVSDAPHLDAPLFQKQDQESHVKCASALGKPMLQSGKSEEPPLKISPKDLARLIAEDDEALANEAAQRKHQESFEGFLETLPNNSMRKGASSNTRNETTKDSLQKNSHIPKLMFAYNDDAHSSARVVQRLARRRRLKKQLAATKIQAQFRAFLCYRDAVRERRRLNLTATCIQCIHRGNAGRRLANWARFAPRLQQVIRMYLAKLQVEMMRRRRSATHQYLDQVYLETARRIFRLNHACKIIQQAWRAYSDFHRKRFEAAITIQNIVRAWLVVVRNLRHFAATKIQSRIARGVQARYLTWHIRCAVLAEEARRKKRENEIILARETLARKRILRWIRGPCPKFPGLQTIGWWCMGHTNRNGRRYCKRMRARFLAERSECHRQIANKLMSDRKENAKRKRNWRNEDKAEKKRRYKESRKNQKLLEKEKRNRVRMQRRMNGEHKTSCCAANSNSQTSCWSTSCRATPEEMDKIQHSVMNDEQSKKYQSSVQHRKLLNKGERLRVDIAVWTYCRGDGMLRRSDVGNVLKLLGAPDSLTDACSELFDEKNRYGDETLQRLLVTKNAWMSAKKVYLDTKTSAESKEDKHYEGKQKKKLSVKFEKEQKRILDLRGHLGITNLMEDRITRSQFQQWWLSEERTLRLRQHRAHLCPPKCFSMPEMCRGMTRLGIRQWQFATWTELKKFTECRLMAEAERISLLDTLYLFRRGHIEVDKKDPVESQITHKLTQIVVKEALEEMIKRVIEEETKSKQIFADHQSAAKPIAIPFDANNIMERKINKGVTKTNIDMKMNHEERLMSLLLPRGRRHPNCPRFSCKKCHASFALWRPFLMHSRECRNDIKSTNSYSHTYVQPARKRRTVEDVQKLITGTGVKGDEKDIEYDDDDNDGEELPDRPEFGPLPDLSDLVDEKWIQESVLHVEDHILECKKFLKNLAKKEMIIEKENLKVSRRTLESDRNSKEKESSTSSKRGTSRASQNRIPGGKLQKNSNYFGQDSRTTLKNSFLRQEAKLEIRILTWSLGCMDHVSAHAIGKIAGVLWGPAFTNPQRILRLVNILSTKLAEDPHVETSGIPYRRVCEWWVNERLYSMSLVPPLESELSLMAVPSLSQRSRLLISRMSCGHSKVESRMAKLMAKNRKAGISSIVAACGRNHYFTVLGKMDLGNLSERAETYTSLDDVHLSAFEQNSLSASRSKNNVHGNVLPEGDNSRREEPKSKIVTHAKADANEIMKNRYLFHLTDPESAFDRKLATERYPKWVVLFQLGFPLEISVFALQMSANDIHRAENWLLKQSLSDIHELQQELLAEANTRRKQSTWLRQKGNVKHVQNGNMVATTSDDAANLTPGSIGSTRLEGRLERAKRLKTEKKLAREKRAEEKRQRYVEKKKKKKENAKRNRATRRAAIYRCLNKPKDYAAHGRYHLKSTSLGRCFEHSMINREVKKVLDDLVQNVIDEQKILRINKMTQRVSKSNDKVSLELSTLDAGSKNEKEHVEERASGEEDDPEKILDAKTEFQGKAVVDMEIDEEENPIEVDLESILRRMLLKVTVRIPLNILAEGKEDHQ